MMRIFGDRVLVALPPDPGELKTPSGLVLMSDPDVNRTPTRGIVVAIGQHTGKVDVDEVVGVIVEMVGNTVGATVSEVAKAVKRLGPAPFDVRVGECVIFPPWVGDQFEQDGIEYVVVREAEIIGVVDAIKNEGA